MSEQMPRREFLKTALMAVGVLLIGDLPDWIELENDQEFKELVQICTEVLNEDELNDLLEVEDFEQAMGLVFGLLLDKDIEPENYLILQDFLEYYDDQDLSESE